MLPVTPGLLSSTAFVCFTAAMAHHKDAANKGHQPRYTRGQLLLPLGDENHDYTMEMQLLQSAYIQCESKKQDNELLPIVSQNVNQFSKFFH